MKEISQKSGIPYDTVRGWLRRGYKPISAWSNEEWKRKIGNNAKTREKWSPERHQEFRTRLAQLKLGEQNPNWKGDDVVSVKEAEARDHRKFEPALIILRQITGRKWEVHHIDGNGFNHSNNNIALVTRKGHMILDGRLARFIESRRNSKGGILHSS